MRLSIAPKTLNLLRRLAVAADRQGLPLYAVGGCVRDWILGRKDVADLDLAVEGDPRILAGLAGKILKAKPEAFGAFGTLRVHGRDLHVDFATARQEEYPEPACLPKVTPASLERDLFRRDFTINAMAWRLTPQGLGPLRDPYCGRRDLDRGILRVLHPESFRDDPTRVFRGARFLCRFGFKLAPGFLEMARQALESCVAAKLSRHRLCQELLRILAEKDPAAPLRKLKSWGYLDLVFPDLPVRVAGETVEERLASLVFALGPRSEEFLRSLPVERGMAQRISEALRLVRQKACPRTALADGVARIVALARPGLPRAALKPLFLDGHDLQAAGLKPGPEFRAILDEAARCQWAGKISSRGQALKWLGLKLRHSLAGKDL